MGANTEKTSTSYSDCTGRWGKVACMLLVLMLFLLVIVDVGDTMSFCRFAVDFLIDVRGNLYGFMYYYSGIILQRLHLVFRRCSI